MTAVQVFELATVTPDALTHVGQWRIWRVVDRETGAHVTVTVDTTGDDPTCAHLAPTHRVVGLYVWLPSASRSVRSAGIAHAPPEVRRNAHAAYLWARGQVRAHVALAKVLAPLQIRLS